MSRCFRVCLAFAILAAANYAAPRAQGSASADEKELAAYTLTLPTLKKVMSATRSTAELASQDPRYQQMAKMNLEIDAVEAELEKLQAKDQLTTAEQARADALQEQLGTLEDRKTQLEEKLSAENPQGNPESLAEMEQRIRSFAPMARALEREGLTPREYSKFLFAMMQASMVFGLSQGKVDYAKLPPGVNPANVKFVAEHKTELEAMQKEFEQLEQKIGR
jgi:Skp family chaperone for outer membrane proteins